MPRLTDAQFAAVEPHLPRTTKPPKLGNREALEAMLHMLVNGCTWRGMPERYGRWHTIYMRFRRWADSGVLSRAFRALRKAGGPDVVAMLDSTSIRAHHSASGAQKNTGRRRSDGRAVA